MSNTELPLREQLLQRAILHTCGDRDVEYGPPYINLTDVANLWATYLEGKFGVTLELTAEDAAWFNVLQKIARTYKSAKHDTYEDAAAYSAIAGEVSQ